MPYLVPFVLILATVSLSGCSGAGSGMGHDSAAMVPGGALGRLRPKVDPRYVQMAEADIMADREQQALRAQQAQSAQMQGQNNGAASGGGFKMDGLGRVLT